MKNRAPYVCADSATRAGLPGICLCCKFNYFITLHTPVNMPLGHGLGQSGSASVADGNGRAGYGLGFCR
jgi:hypothetical protein